MVHFYLLIIIILLFFINLSYFGDLCGVSFLQQNDKIKFTFQYMQSFCIRQSTTGKYITLSIFVFSCEL